MTKQTKLIKIGLFKNLVLIKGVIKFLETSEKLQLGKISKKICISI